MFFTSWVEHQVLKTGLKVLSFPATGPYKAAKWMLEQIHNEVTEEQESEERVVTRLTELQLRYELGEIEEEDYRAEERAIMEELATIREAKRDEQFEPSEFWWSRTFGGEQS